MPETGFVTLVSSESLAADAALLVQSLRAFGGVLHDAPVFILHPGSIQLNKQAVSDENTHPTRFEIVSGLESIPFGAKVSACANAEQMLSGKLAFHLDSTPRAALRPVHIKNIGSPIDDAPDDFWSAIYRQLGGDLPDRTVESYVDARLIRPYFNTHLFAIDPSLNLLQTWLDYFKTLACDDQFMSEHCRDDLHQIFLHQALFSALLAQRLGWDRLLILPPEYSYPLHLHPDIPPDRQAESLERLVCPVYEEPFKYPDTLNGLQAERPLANWLRSFTGSSD
jgi:hypothetical protein